MLVLSRRPGQCIRIGPDVEVVVLSTEGDQVRLGIRAPREITVLRGELVAQVQDENRLAAAPLAADLLQALREPLISLADPNPSS